MTFLGQDTPVDDVAAVALRLKPDLVVVAATARKRLSSIAGELQALGTVAPLALAGAGADAALATRVGARVLEGDPVSAADALTTHASP